MLTYFKKYRLQMFLTIFLTFVSSLLFAFNLFSMMFIVQSLLEVNIEVLLIWGGTLIVAMIIAMITDIFNNYYQEKIFQKIIFEIKVDLINKVYFLKYRQIQKNEVDYQSIFINDIATVEENYLQNINVFFSNVFILIFTIGSMFYFSYIIALVGITLIVIQTFVPVLINKLIQKKTKIYNEKMNEYSSKTLKILESIHTLFFNNKLSLLNNKLLKQEHNTRYHESYKYNVILDTKNLGFSCMVYIFDFLLIFISVVLLANNLLNTSSYQLGIGMVLSVATISNNAFRGASNLLNATTSVRSIKPILNKWKDIKKIDNKQTNWITEINSIVLDKVNLTLDNKEIINNFNLTINKNQKYLIVGESGKGKSTIAKLISNLYEPTKGRVLYNNKSLVGSESQNNIVQKISYIEPTPFIFEDNIKDNITLYDQNVDETKYKKIIDLLNLHKLDDSKIIDGEKFNLSTGQKQRINIARSLYKNYKFLILDEAMSNIDHKTTEKIEKYLLTQNDLTVVYVTHHVNLRNQKLYNQVIEL